MVWIKNPAQSRYQSMQYLSSRRTLQEGVTPPKSGTRFQCRNAGLNLRATNEVANDIILTVFRPSFEKVKKLFYALTHLSLV